ncbi:unnamed protein product [Nezara viridula]|uniref:Uncharacterized protein n=1 Tax=Nezara viridula TaxID=85310 RepID=A0A9P0EDF2_NEZVI|nr:unnamed protein product [Nezara viridula]
MYSSIYSDECLCPVLLNIHRAPDSVAQLESLRSNEFTISRHSYLLTDVDPLRIEGYLHDDVLGTCGGSFRQSSCS